MKTCMLTLIPIIILQFPSVCVGVTIMFPKQPLSDVVHVGICKLQDVAEPQSLHKAVLIRVQALVLQHTCPQAADPFQSVQVSNSLHFCSGEHSPANLP